MVSVRRVLPRIAISPDGRQFVYASNHGLYIRSIGELNARLITGTDNENGNDPFFSPDGKWIAYFSNNQLKKIPVMGGSPIPLCDVNSQNISGSWARDKILFGGANTNGVWQISDNGGTAKLLFENDENSAFLLPKMLPGGKSILFTKAKP